MKVEMIFQAIDDKSECIGVYVDGEFHFDKIPTDLTKTWRCSGSTTDKNVEYAHLYASGKTLYECCPMSLLGALEAVQKKMGAYVKSFNIAKVDLNEHCIFDLIPHDFLMEFCEVKNLITEYVFDNYEKPLNYSHLDSVEKLLHKIRYQELNLKTNDCRELLTSSKQRTQIQQYTKNQKYVDYNLFGTVTGRLTTKSNSFPILTVKKEIRKIIKPHNDLFISLDYNGAEVRTLLDLCGEKQPQIDIHEWNANHLFEQEVTRDECKVRFFAWLYNPDSDDIDTTYYDKEKVLDKYYIDGYINTPYNRKIKVEKRKALNYLIQSTTADMVLEKAVTIDKMLENKKSNISMIIHDEIVIDYCDEDRDLIPHIKEVFEGKYVSNVKGGKNLFDLEEMNI
jgi:hypothetical protein